MGRTKNPVIIIWKAGIFIRLIRKTKPGREIKEKAGGKEWEKIIDIRFTCVQVEQWHRMDILTLEKGGKPIMGSQPRRDCGALRQTKGT